MSLHPLEAFFHALDPRRERDSYHLDPATDIIDVEEHQILFIELPGVAKKDVDITLAEFVPLSLCSALPSPLTHSHARGNTLHITGHLRKPTEYQQEKASFLLAERRYGTFRRSFVVARGVKEEEIKAKMEQGLLRVEVPKRAKEGEVRERRIEVA